MFLLATLMVLASMFTMCMFFHQQMLEFMRVVVYYKQAMCVHFQDDPVDTTKKLVQALLVAPPPFFALDMTDAVEDIRYIMQPADEWDELTNSYCDACMLSPHMLNVPDIYLYLQFEHMSSQCIRVVSKGTPFLGHLETTPDSHSMKFVDKMTSATLVGPSGEQSFDCFDQLLMFAGPRSDFFDHEELTVMHFMRYCVVKYTGCRVGLDTLHVTLRSGAIFKLGIDDHLSQITAKKHV